MNILQIGSYLYPDTPGGAEISAQNVALALEGLGHKIVRLRWASRTEVSAVSRVSKSAQNEWALSSWRPYTPLETRPGLSKIKFYGFELLSPVSQPDFNYLITHENIDAVIVHSFRGMGYDILSKIASTDLPTVIFLHDFALTCINKGMFRSGSSCENLCLECKVVSKINHKSLKHIQQLTIIGPSIQMVNRTRENLSIHNATYTHIPNANKYNLSSRARNHKGKLTIGYVGRLEHDKGFLQLLDVVLKIREKHSVDFVIAGSGSLDSSAIDFSSKNHWAKYLGYVQPSQMAEVYDTIDIIVMPSIWAENFPGVLVQALGNGIPAIGFRTGGIPEIIEEGVTGLLAEPANFESLEASICSLITSPGTFESMSRASISSAQRFDPETLRSRLLEELTRAIEPQRSQT